ncbi:hypothetical protein F4778DRAFT_145031 [Xylariomycetidae sp. FL2044]|nr:hypothetical protein F4778DRAFT_145031 [Xylariomycetidae sp. FL2044]
MNSLPQEIYDEISALLQGPGFDRPALATISRRWQATIERNAFKVIYLKSTDLGRFQKIIHNERRSYVDTVHYIIVLPAYADDQRCRFERENDRQANDEAFTAAIHSLFHLLKSWDANDGAYLHLSLHDAYSISDHESHRSSSPNLSWGSGFMLHKDEHYSLIDFGSWRHRYSYLRLANPAALPLLPVVRSFSAHRMTRNICDRVPVDIAARLPNLQTGDWRMNDWEIPYLALHRAHRQDLAQAVTSCLPQASTLQSLTLECIMITIHSWCPRCSPGTLHPENANHDTLSDAIRTSTAGMSNLTELKIRGIVDSSLFWPSLEPTGPFWQKLKHLHVFFYLRRPSGGSYINNSWDTVTEPPTRVPPGYGDTEEEDVTAARLFSMKDHLPIAKIPPGWGMPDNDSLVPLIEGFGRACLQIPMLESARLHTFIPGPLYSDHSRISTRRCPWGVWYFSPGVTYDATANNMDPAFSQHSSQRRLFWDVQDWRPGSNLQNILRSIGHERYGPQLAEHFLDTWETVRKDQEIERLRDPGRTLP